MNTTLGLKLNDERATVSLKISNLFDDEVQQHVFGDILSRQVVGELRLSY